MTFRVEEDAALGLVRVMALVTMAAFWENSFRNMGLQARAFVDEPQALAWLAGGS